MVGFVLAGALLGLGASACWALANVAVQRAGQAVGPYRALLWAQVVGVVFVAAFAIPVERPALTLTPATLAWVAVAGLAALVAYVCLFYAFAHGRLTLAVPIMSSWAVIAAGLSLVLFGERLSAGQLAGGAVVIAGAAVVSRYAPGAGSAPGGAVAARAPRAPRWLLASFGAAVGFGVLIPAIRALGPAFGDVGSIAVVYLADAILGLPLALLFRVSLAPPAGRAWIPVLLAGLFETAGFACIAVGGRLAPLALVSPLASLASALTILAAWIFLGERPGRGVLVGAALVSAGVVALAL
jgi:drug/metabolite transporter (DMT)-like permease